MTYTPIQLDIIQVFGRKELSKGLIILKERISEIIAIDYEREGFYRMIDDGENTFSGSIKGAEILGHIPHLEDVFRVARDRKMFYGIKGEYVKEKEFEYIEYLWFSNIDIGEKCIPYNPTIPLLEQPESVLIQLLNLFK